MKPTMLIRALVVVSALAMALAPCVRAEDLGAVRARMEQRLSKVDELKAKGALGENNRGFLEERDSAAGAAAVATEENRDREAVYAALAEKTKSTSVEVGKARARQIAQNSKAGVWIQDAGGEWRKK